MLAKEPGGFSGIIRRMGYVALLPLLRLPYRMVLRDLPTALSDAGVSPVDAAQISLSRLVAFALCSPVESWANLAVGWLSQGFPINGDIFMAAEALLQSKQGSKRVRMNLANILARWRKSGRPSAGPGSAKALCTVVYLISKPLLVYVRNQFGGLTAAASQAMRTGGGRHVEGSVKLSLFPQDDPAFGYAILDTLSRAFARASANDSEVADAVLRLLSFYYPVCSSNALRFDDSGGTVRAIGPVLAPERCRYLLEYWSSVERRTLEKQLDKYPIFFDWAERPNERFHTARQLLGLLGRHAAFLRQAVARDYLYFSYDSSSL